jgi:hypothetical protein
MKKLKNLLIALSVIVNVCFLFDYGMWMINEPTNKYGVLKEDVQVGIINTPGTIFTLQRE